MTVHFEFLNETASNSSNKMKVVLGGHTIKAYVFSPKGFHSIGIVQFGMEFGVLAVSNNGDYYRVNGSEVTRLDNRDVENAICRSKSMGRGKSFAASRSTELSCARDHAARVFIKKHRRIDPELVAKRALHTLAA